MRDGVERGTQSPFESPVLGCVRYAVLAVFPGDLGKLVQDRLTVPGVVDDDFNVLAALRNPGCHETGHLVLTMHADIAPGNPGEQGAVDRARRRATGRLPPSSYIYIYIYMDHSLLTSPCNPMSQHRAATAVYDDELLLRAAGRVRAGGASPSKTRAL
ncbi:hypothetical protein DL763_003954 [Monosporascus cannonballus]|nr:hypothetical protein DL763_003954 [Monosporascus cannonballus]